MSSVTRFIFLADSRGDYKNDPNDLFAEEILNDMTERILSLDPKPDFVIFNGDMVAKKAYSEESDAVQRWLATFSQPLQREGITVYVTPGNHIVDQRASQNDRPLKYVDDFRHSYMFEGMSPVDNPLSKSVPEPYRGVTFSATHGNMHLATVPSFTTHRRFDLSGELGEDEYKQPNKSFEYYVSRANLEWLENNLKGSDAKFKVFVTHVPLYPTGHHYKDEKGLHAHPANRDALMKILIDNKVDMILVSHEHVYARMYLKPSNSDGTKDGDEIIQVTVGSAGAPLPTIVPKRDDVILERYLDVLPYTFMVADVSGTGIEVSVYDQFGWNVDRFSVNR